jgi:hypothetical protein
VLEDQRAKFRVADVDLVNLEQGENVVNVLPDPGGRAESNGMARWQNTRFRNLKDGVEDSAVKD